MMKDIVISVQHLTMGYGSRIIQHDISFDIEAGSIVCILGGSGCGKSTLLKHLIGLCSPVSGEILLHGKSIVHCSDEERLERMRTFGVAYQSGALLRSMTVAENIALPMEEYTTLSPEQIRERVEEKLRAVNLSGFGDYMPGDLSGGMIKRAAFARAMALDPDILFFDEPSAGLDPISSANLDQLILNIRKNTGATIMVVTHELASIYTIADRVIMFASKAGGIIGEGTPAELRDQSQNEFIRNFMNREAERNVIHAE